jgi:penicillin amidase
MIPKQKLYLLGFAFLALTAPLSYQVDRIASSLPKLDGEARLPGLSAPVAIEADAMAIPSVDAPTRADAQRALGYLHARDRLFQIDLMRRKAAGRLAEIFGEKALPVDQAQRVYQLQRAAEASAAALPEDQRAALAAYAEGVNAYLGSALALPPEFRVLHYRPEPWQPTDSLLVALGMFQTLSGDQERDERMLTAMEHLLPPELTAFLTPDTDEFVQTLVGGAAPRRPARPVPVDAIRQTLAEAANLPRAEIGIEPSALGSNNWAVAGRKTADGRAMVANDMHLPLSVPNTWYRARLRYPGADLSGVTLPGLPLMVVGSNGHVAWGFTNVEGDFLDLVKLEVNPANPEEYRTPDGWRRFESRTEEIRVKDSPPVSISLRGSQWGPVSPNPLLGAPVAIHWTALQPKAVNLRLLDMDQAATLEHAMAVLNQSGIPPQNAVLADDQGHIAWTYTGYFPKRYGLDGSASRAWADGAMGWNGYIPPEQLPRVVDPPQGFLVTANNRTLGKDYPYPISHAFSHSYRAYRIAERLVEKATLTEADLLDVQLDTASGFYEFYRKLALDALGGMDAGKEPLLADAAEEIKAWDGRLDPDSRGIGLLVQWRQDLADALFGPLMGRCAAAEPGFAYRWREQDTPLRALLTERIPATLPGGRPADWQSFLRDSLKSSAAGLLRGQEATRLAELTWGRVNRVAVRHPFSRSFPAAGWLLDMPETAGGCNSFCVKVLHGVHGASERMVVSPGHPEDGILHIPGGQSGHPLSAHYRDQEAAWAEGRPLPFLPGSTEHRLRLVP